MQGSQIIALLLPDSSPETPLSYPVQLGRNAVTLMRDQQGRMTVEEVVADREFMKKLLDTGTFRRGKPILDPVSQKITGYQMEMIGPKAKALLESVG
jgi:hypothetical protein